MADAVASSTPSAAGDAAIATDGISTVPSIAHNHPPYDDMILRAIEALKGRKGSSWYAISKYISDNYSDLPPTHASLLTDHLRQLHSKGVIRMLKLCYKLEDGSRKRGRPPKSVPSGEPKKRGRPPKLLSDVAATNKGKPGRPPKGTVPLANGPVYIVSQAEQLSSGLLQGFPGAVAIVLPKSLLSEKAAKSPILILPKGIQSLVDASAGKKKRGRPKNVDIKKKRGRPRKKAAFSRQEPGSYGDGNGKPANLVAKGPGRPWKIRDLLVPGNTREILEKSRETGILGSVQGAQDTTGLEVKKRSVGRPRKTPLIEGPNPPSDVLVN
ncbi:hypothetical protein IEQ34_001532 [Dendrobium chrysotoxum]|uniref:H15 domain-containing protein n=1 Tax=Dendrobium chrysotoxum TaxID=161865 RepID=A0AAV7HNX0_DENCH|nr:hypothetical protein IEQ34_001532 [Dendrobium chrysotoxum]